MNRVSTCSGGAGPNTFSTPAPFSLFTCATKGGWGYARVHQAGWAVEWKLLMTRELREVECQIWRRRKVMTFTGHEDYDSLKPYIAITDKTRKNLMMTMFSK